MKEKSIKINAVLNVMKTVLSLVFPLITFPYITRVLQVNAIGKYDFSVSVISYFSLIAALGITTYAVREGTKYRGDQEMNQFASEIFSINLYATIVSYILLFLALMFVDKLKSYNIVIGILSLEILLATLSVVWIYNIYEDFGYITFVTFILQFVSIILMLLFVHSADDLYKYVIISVISSSGSGLFMFFMQEICAAASGQKTTSETFKTDYDRVFDNNRCNYLYQFRYNNSWMADGRLSCWNLRNSSQNI